MSIFKHYMNYFEGDLDEAGWSPLMKKHLKKTTREHDDVVAERKAERRAERNEKRKAVKGKEHAYRSSIKRNWKEKEDEREDEAEREKEGTLMSRAYDDQEKLSPWLKKEFGDMLIDVVGDLRSWHKDDEDKDIEDFIEMAMDFSVKDMVQGHDPKKFKRLQELKRILEWDWEGWLFDEMADRARAHYKKEE